MHKLNLNGFQIRAGDPVPKQPERKLCLECKRWAKPDARLFGVVTAWRCEHCGCRWTHINAQVEISERSEE